MEKLKEKITKDLGKWLLDISKYTATGILIAKLFSTENWSGITYVLSAMLILTTLSIGLIFLWEQYQMN